MKIDYQEKPDRGSRPLTWGDRLNSWKQIAVYLDRQVRTVQRWEKREGLPVHRHFHLSGSTAYAFKWEIDAWLAGRESSEFRGVQKHANNSSIADMKMRPSPFRSVLCFSVRPYLRAMWCAKRRMKSAHMTYALILWLVFTKNHFKTKMAQLVRKYGVVI